MGGSGGALGELWEAQGQLWEALAELQEALGALWEGLYIQKLPINRSSGRYVSNQTYLSEFVLTHVILAPGARGRGGPSSGLLHRFRGNNFAKSCVPKCGFTK